MLFSTDRLLIRKLKVSDLDAFHEMQRNPNVMRYTGDTTKTKEEDIASLNHVLACYDKPNNDFWIWAIVRKSDGILVGTCAIIKTELHEHNETIKDEIGFRFTEKFWGNGYATEITSALISYAFEKHGKSELVAEVDELNIASVKILERYMTFAKAYYAPHYKSNDRLYIVRKENWNN
jgi:RimJ/RimL family protein N-acetyltransferase